MKKYFLHIAIIILFALSASSMAGVVQERNIKIATGELELPDPISAVQRPVD